MIGKSGPDGAHVLVCDADSPSLRALRVVLGDAGFSVDETRTAGEALDCAALHAPDVAIFELALPDGDGVELCRRLHDWCRAPVILLSAVDEQAEKVHALDARVDDYITKPFQPGELVARLRAVLRRAGHLEQGPIVQLDGLEINLAARQVRRDGREVHLTPTEFKLLRLLVRNRGRLLTHDALLEQVWGPAYVGGTETLRTHIANLREKIEAADGRRQLTTHHGIGYRLAA